jgi:aminoglycoside phosphotransferase (APT) family kinase protein
MAGSRSARARGERLRPWTVVTEPSSAVRRFWSLSVADAMSGRRVTDVESLEGGNYARAWRITLDGPPRALVGRLLPTRSLTPVVIVNQFLDRCRSAGLPAPLPIWSRGTPAVGVQSQLLTWIDGTTTPPECSVEVDRLADAIVRIASIDTVGLELPDFPPLPSTRWQGRIRRSTVGGAVLDRLLSFPPPALGGGLVHGDLCEDNLLWNDDELVGIIDWDRASRGSCGVDVAMLWTDLLIRHGLDVAETFLRTLDEKGLDLDDLRYWQLRMVASSLGGEIDSGIATRLAFGFEHLAE